MFSQYPPLFRVWFGFRMFYAVSDAKYMEIIFTSPQALRKEFLYSMAEPVVGQGLFTARSGALKQYLINSNINLIVYNSNHLEKTS